LPVDRRKCDKNKKIEHGFDSIKTKRALAGCRKTLRLSLRGAERRGNPDKIPPLSAELAKKRKQNAKESLDCFPPRFARGRNDGDRNRLFQQPAEAFCD